MSPRQSLGAVAVLLLAAAQLWSVLPQTLDRASAGIAQGARGMNDSTLQARRRVFGRHADAIERIKQAIPAQSSFLLAGDNSTGALYFAAYELAPRRLHDAGCGWCTEQQLRDTRPPGDAPPYVVVVPSPPEVPLIVPTAEYFGRHP